MATHRSTFHGAPPLCTSHLNTFLDGRSAVATYAHSSGTAATSHLNSRPLPPSISPPSSLFQAAHFSALCQPPSLRLGPSPRRATPPSPHQAVLPPRPAADGAVTADMFLLVVSCFVRAVHCAPPLTGVDDGAQAVAGGPGVGLLGGGGSGFGPEHLGEVAKLSRLAADIFRRVKERGCRGVAVGGGRGGGRRAFVLRVPATAACLSECERAELGVFLSWCFLFSRRALRTLRR